MPVTYKKIASVTVGAGGAANMQFTSIPGTYTDLQVLVSARSTNGSLTRLYIGFNGSTSGFSNIYLQGNGSSAGSGSIARFIGQLSGTDYTSNTFGSTTLYVPNYTSSNNKTMSADNVVENNATTGYDDLSAHSFTSSSAITSIELSPFTGNFAQYSTATLYGISKS
jgi:hypothetical protein